MRNNPLSYLLIPTLTSILHLVIICLQILITDERSLISYYIVSVLMDTPFFLSSIFIPTLIFTIAYKLTQLTLKNKAASLFVVISYLVIFLIGITIAIIYTLSHSDYKLQAMNKTTLITLSFFALIIGTYLFVFLSKQSTSLIYKITHWLMFALPLLIFTDFSILVFRDISFAFIITYFGLSIFAISIGFFCYYSMNKLALHFIFK